MSDRVVFDLHAHAAGFVPQPFRAAWRAATPRAPAQTGLGHRTGIDAQVCSAVGDPVVTRTYVGRSAWAAVEAQLIGVERQAAAAGAAVVTSVDELLAARAAGRLSVLLGVEGADALGTDVDAWFERGVRTVGLVHLRDNALGSTCLPWQSYVGRLSHRRTASSGLTRAGARVISRMNERGLLVDLAHADRETLLGAVETTSAPVVASHSGARALQDFARYLSDDELRAIAGTGGLIGLWPFRYGGKGVRDATELVAHARHVADLVGAEHLALGTDTNGVPGVMDGFGSSDGVARITDALCHAGFDEWEIDGILGGNALRVLRQVEACARSPKA